MRTFAARPTALVLALTLLAAACAEPAPEAPEAEPSATPAATEAAPAPDTAATGTIPTALHGRWGLVAADCTSTRGDAKGLMEVSGDGVKFYESRGTVEGTGSAAGTTGQTSFRGTFAMTGEGMNWNREMALTLSEDGQSLVRSEFGEEALAEPLTYSKCA